MKRNYKRNGWKERMNYSTRTKNIVLVLLILLFFFTISIGFSMLTQQFGINTNVEIRPDREVRITNVDGPYTTNGAYENGNYQYSHNLFITKGVLPNKDSTIQYKLTITNNGTNDKSLDEITSELLGGVEYRLLDFQIGDEIPAGESIIITIEFYNSTGSSITYSTELEFLFSDVYVDITPPTITFSKEKDSWFNQDTNITISATDDRTITEFKYCTTTESSCTPSTDANIEGTTISLTEEGKHTICVIAVDNAKKPNTTTECRSYTIDKTAPILTVGGHTSDFEMTIYSNEYVDTGWVTEDELKKLGYNPTDSGVESKTQYNLTTTSMEKVLKTGNLFPMTSNTTPKPFVVTAWNSGSYGGDSDSSAWKFAGGSGYYAKKANVSGQRVGAQVLFHTEYAIYPVKINVSGLSADAGAGYSTGGGMIIEVCYADGTWKQVLNKSGSEWRSATYTMDGETEIIGVRGGITYGSGPEQYLEAHDLSISEWYQVEQTSTTTEWQDTIPEGEGTIGTRTLYRYQKGFALPKAVVTDNLDDSPIITTSGNVNPNVPEKYEIIYTATDKANNTRVLKLKITVTYPIGTEWNYEYTGNEKSFEVPANGYYKIETWGAQGGNAKSNVGGYGGYSTGIVSLSKDQTIYINVGGQGAVGTSGTMAGGYNGGGTSAAESGISKTLGGGGGATHIASTSGLLSTLSSKQENILIVSGGGGGSNYENSSYNGNGGNGGGYIGNDGKKYNNSGATGGTQTSGGGFGQGASGTSNYIGGGGGYYGGRGTSTGYAMTGAGGSGYIGNPLLTDKFMYCYNCTTSDEESTKTYTTTNVSETPISNYAKQGDGYAKITYLGKLTTYSITYVLNGGTNPSDAKAEYVSGFGSASLPEPTKDGYEFVGWYDNSEFTGNAITNIPSTETGDKTFYAKWEEYVWEYASYNYTFPQNANQYYVSPIYDFKCKTGVTLKLTGSIGDASNVNNAFYQLEYSDDGVTFTKMPMKSGCNWYKNINNTESAFWNDGNIEESGRGIRFQWTTNYRSELSYYEKHRYWRVTCQTINNSGTDSITLENQVYSD